MFKEVREQLTLQHSASFQPVDHSLCQQYAQALRDILANAIALNRQGRHK